MYYVDEGRVRHFRGIALTLFGVFVFVFSSVVIFWARASPVYFGMAALSAGSVMLTYLSARSRTHFGHMMYLLLAGTALAAEASVIALYLADDTAVVYSLLTLLGSALALKGTVDIESYVRESESSRRKTTLPPMHEEIP